MQPNGNIPKRNPFQCPKCESIEIVNGTTLVEHYPYATLEDCYCLDCKATWENTYKYINYTMTNGKTNE